ncbi:PQQ-binding-like beta-propeller repeat protein [bacterium]|nr:PQQ-binding-like beta-propeller repeat protein [bacterium]
MRSFDSRRCDVRRLAFVLVALTGTALLSRTASAEDWPTYRHGNDRSGATAENFNGAKALQWRFVAPNPPHRAWASEEGRTIEGHVIKDRVRFDDAFQPVVVGNRVWFGSSSDHQVYCLDLTTGKTLWTFFTGAPVRLAPTVYQGAVYFGSDDGYAYCVAADTGTLKWKRRGGPTEEWFLGRGEMISRWAVRTGVMIRDGIAYFGAGIFPHENVYLHAVDAQTGQAVWTRDDISEADAARDDLSPQGYLLATDELLFVPSGRSMPATFERATGRLLHKKTYSWRSSAGGVVGGTRAILADGQLYSGGAFHMLAIDQKAGDLGFGWFEARQMVVAGDAAWIASGSSIAKLNRLEYAVASRKRHDLEMSIYSQTSALRGKSGKDADELREKIRAAQVELEELASVGIEWLVKNQADAELVLAGDTLLAGGDGDVTGYNAATGEETLKLAVNGEARGLVFANGHLVVSTTAGEVSCFGMSAAGEAAVIADSRVDKSANPYAADTATEVCRTAAEQIVAETGITRGFCLVAGSEDGRLAYELATRTDLIVYGIEPDADKVAESRKRLATAGLYGTRVTIHQADYSEIPYSNYFANLIVSDTHVRTGQLPGATQTLLRHLKPMGGVFWLGRTTNDADTLARADKYLESGGLADQSTVAKSETSVRLNRGMLPGAGNWSHQYGDVGNTAVVGDKRVKGGLGVLWFGDPGPGDMVNRHDGAVGPLSVNGRLFVQGDATISAYDAYNGLFLWKYENKEALRTGVFQNQNPGNLAASDERLFHFLKDECFEVDAATGKVVAVHRLPKEYDDGTREWGYLAYHNGILFGTATVREDVEARLRRRGRTKLDSTDAIFAIDVKTGKHLWEYKGGSISEQTIALSDENVFFIDSTITSEERARILREDKSDLEVLTGEARQIAEDRMKKLDARTAVSLDARTGEKRWAAGVDVTDCSEIGIGGGKLTLMHKDGVLILCGANANGHYWNQFIAGEFKRRRLVALSAEAGYTMWKKDANYRHRPIIVGNRVIAEPWAFDLTSGDQIMQQHPLTGQDVPWSIIRPGHHCGMLTGCDNMLLFRSGYTGFYNLENDEGTRHFAGHRLGCWINAIPANGLVMIPEASAGCVCQFSIASTIVLEPREARHPWTLVSATGAKLPVREMSLNFGAPGDRRDRNGKLWLAYPRPNPHKTTSLDLEFELQPKFSAGGFTSVSEDTHPVAGTETSWLYTSWASGLSELTVPLRGENDGPEAYDLTLHFAQIREGTAKFDVEVNGKVVISDLELSHAVDALSQAVVRQVPNVDVTRSLTIRLLPKSTDEAKARPVLNALEVHSRQAVAEK